MHFSNYYFIVFFLPIIAIAKLEEDQPKRKSFSSTISDLNEWYLEHSTIVLQEEEELEEKASLINNDNDVAKRSNNIRSFGEQRVCEDPIAAVLKTLQCIDEGDVRCSNSGYDSRKFRKLHNGVDTMTQMSYLFWFGAFRLLTFELDIDHVYKITTTETTSTIGIRYIEKVTTTNGTSLFLEPSYTAPFNQTLYQHEHAIVTVDENCKMILWDQTGDNKEQTDVDDIADGIVCRVNPFSPCS